MTRLTTLLARRATDEALATLWSLSVDRVPCAAGSVDTGYSQTQDEYRHHLAERPGEMGRVCRRALAAAGLNAAQTAALERYLALEAEVAARERRTR